MPGVISSHKIVAFLLVSVGVCAGAFYFFVAVLRVVYLAYLELLEYSADYKFIWFEKFCDSKSEWWHSLGCSEEGMLLVLVGSFIVFCHSIVGFRDQFKYSN